jgi:hypothetical protein
VALILWSFPLFLSPVWTGLSYSSIHFSPMFLRGIAWRWVEAYIPPLLLSLSISYKIGWCLFGCGDTLFLSSSCSGIVGMVRACS